MSGTLLRVHAAGAVLALAALAMTGCGAGFDHVKLTMAAGSDTGVYYKLSTALADGWTRDPGIPRPQVVSTAGSVDNLERLRTGQAQVGFSAADAAEDGQAAPGGHRLYALARMHDDYLQVAVRADVPATKLADLRGLRVSVGAPDSGVRLIAERLLRSADIPPDELKVRYLDLNATTDAMRAGELDAFFWSGGVPTAGVTTLASTVRIRMLDLEDVLPGLRGQYPVYGSATLPASAYELPGGPVTTPVTTLVVRNFLLVTDAMPDDVAEALLRGLFRAQPDLVAASPVARSIEVRSAIETTPLPLHPGAKNYYRDVKV
ncbi:TAXI family TRAP transporter solute-binding subunit [Saccharothrix algeriensis]|uniref:TRAP transporter TAXI family solute receptor n=1 Tax=Saccharothrix algeriensis TaxID=173560 RepID=A0ABS2S446_9PSEU|nr:TAXI family TRAP transporter solute-binding subunit [Saccharothrix algeriensis]MBM7810720.1 TRAP transporter TAXI family solute receptor [Saccharothrix algeriensis]